MIENDLNIDQFCDLLQKAYSKISEIIIKPLNTTYVIGSNEEIIVEALYKNKVITCSGNHSLDDLINQCKNNMNDILIIQGELSNIILSLGNLLAEDDMRRVMALNRIQTLVDEITRLRNR
jgi:hypothetical protein